MTSSPQYEREQAAIAAQARVDEVMASPRYPGREALARTLLTLKGPHRMLPGEIITALEKAPKSGGELAAPASSQASCNLPPPGNAPPPGNIPPVMAAAFMTPEQLEWERLYQAGA